MDWQGQQNIITKNSFQHIEKIKGKPEINFLFQKTLCISESNGYFDNIVPLLQIFCKCLNVHRCLLESE